MHERQGIRDAVVACLTGTAPDYATAAEARVFKSRLAPLRTAQLPAICVYTDDETVAEGSKDSSPRELKRTVRLAIDAWVSAASNVDDELDDLALEIETAMDADVNLDRYAFDSVLQSTEIGIKMDGDRPMACAHLIYTVDYYSQLRVGVATDEFDTADVTISTLGADTEDGDNRPNDHITDINQE